MGKTITSLNEKIVGLDANDNTTISDWFKLRGSSILTFYVQGKTGDHDVHEFVIEVSPNGSYNGKLLQNSKVTGIGKLRIPSVSGYVQVRVRCLTAEGNPSTVDIFLQSFIET